MSNLHQEKTSILKIASHARLQREVSDLYVLHFYFLYYTYCEKIKMFYIRM